MKRRYNVNDIIDIDGEDHVVISICGSKIDTIPLRKWVEKYRIVNINGKYMSIEELIDREVCSVLAERNMLTKIRIGDEVFYE